MQRQSHHLNLKKIKTNVFQVKILRLEDKSSRDWEDWRPSAGIPGWMDWFAAMLSLFWGPWDFVDSSDVTLTGSWNNVRIIQHEYSSGNAFGKSRHGIQPGGVQKRMGKLFLKWHFLGRSEYGKWRLPVNFPYFRMSKSSGIEVPKKETTLFEAICLYSSVHFWNFPPCWSVWNNTKFAHSVLTFNSSHYIYTTSPLQLCLGYNVRNVYTDWEKYRFLHAYLWQYIHL